MYKELRETKIKTMTQIHTEYPALACLVINPHEPSHNGILLETRGELFAVSDSEGIDALYSAQALLNKSGIQTMLDSNPLDSDKILPWR